jgi:microcystin-dependent protein
MPYQIDHFDQPNNGSITVNDLDLNQTTDLSFVGKNLPGYAQAIGENFLHLLENFASSFIDRPTKPVLGQLWYDTGTTSSPPQPQLKVWDSTKWVAAGNVTKSIARPTTAVIGDLWVDTSNQQLYLWSGSNWLLVGPQFSEGTQSGPKVESIYDTANLPRIILNFIIAGEVVAIISKDTFTPKITIDGFSVINQGVNMSTKDFDLNGIVLNKFWGTADRATKLVVSGYADGLDANNFLRGDVASTTDYGLTIKNNAGLIVGADLNTTLTNTLNGATVLTNKIEGSSIFLRVNQAGTSSDVLTVTGTSVGINKTNPAEALDINGKLQVSNDIIVTSTTDSTTLSNGSIKTAGGASIAKTLRVGTGAHITGTLTSNSITPVANNVHNIGTNLLRYNTIYANNIGNPDLSTIFTGSFNGAFNGSVTGTATRLVSSTDFSLTGDVISTNTISFDGQQVGGTAIFTTALSSDVIGNKIELLDFLSTDELLVNRPLTGLRKITKTTFLSTVATVPIGSLVSFAGTTLPNGYLLCDGAEVSISSYPELFATIGTSYNGLVPLVGIATFRLPDLRGRMAIGADNMNNGISVPLLPSGATSGTTTLDKDGIPGPVANRVTAVSADTVGLSNGNEEQSINITNLPDHVHDFTGDTGTQFYSVTDSTDPGSIADSEAVGRSVQLQTGYSKFMVNSGSVDSTTTDLPLNIMNPYLTINYIIYTGRIV